MFCSPVIATGRSRGRNHVSERRSAGVDTAAIRSVCTGQATSAVDPMKDHPA